MIDYKGLVGPVGRTVGGVAVLGAVTATGTLQASASAAPATPAVGTMSPAATAAPAIPSAAVQGAALGSTLAPAAPATYTNVKLRYGARGSAVKSLQNSLRSHGASISADGVFGPKTLRAVKSFQSSKGLKVDGVVGPNTWSALGSSSGSSSSSSSSSQPKLRYGSRGSAVRTLQQGLNESGASLAVDGVFGSSTRSAVRSLQSAAGISVDGVVGPNTWKALDSTVRISGTTADRGSGRGSSSSVSGSAIVNAARGALGTRYTWGGSTLSGMDCSGLVYYAYNKAGLDVPRRTAKGYTFNGTIIPASQAKVGDLVAFTDDDYGHMGIYIGNGKIIDASGSRGRVVERSIWNSPHVFVTYR